MKQSWWRCFNSRLSRRIVRSAFVSIVAIELLVFIPTYALRERQLFQQLDTIAAEILRGVRSQVNDETTDQDILEKLKSRNEPGSLIRGGAIYELNGETLRLLDQFDEPPDLDIEAIKANEATQKRERNLERYDILWTSDNFNERYRVVVRLSTEHISTSMFHYTLRRAIILVLLSATVTLVLLIVMQRILIQPILQFREDLTAAGQAASQENTPLFYTFYQTRKDEFGDVAIAFCQMYHQIRQEIRDRKRAELALIEEKEKSERLLLNILPGAIARRLREDPGALASRFDEVTILFADIVGFTSLASRMKPLELLTQLNGMFSAFDKLADHYGLEKIKTIGDAYMVVGGMPTPRPDHADAVLEMAIEMLEVMQEFKQPNGKSYQLRIGINTGPVIAGVIGRKKFSYDLWGDAVNIASRMESHGLIDHIQVTPTTYKRLRHLYSFEKRTGLIIKNVGKMDTYLYVDRKVINTATQVQLPPQDVSVQKS